MTATKKSASARVTSKTAGLADSSADSSADVPADLSADLSAEPQGAQRYAAPALEKGLDILEALAASPAGYTLAELAQKIGRSVSEIFRMAVTLQRRGFVQVDENDRYSLTLKMFELAHRQQPLKSLVSVALPLPVSYTHLTLPTIYSV